MNVRRGRFEGRFFKLRLITKSARHLQYGARTTLAYVGLSTADIRKKRYGIYGAVVDTYSTTYQ